MERICQVDCCDRHVYSKGYCEAHYARQRAGYSMNSPVMPRKVPGAICTIDGCDKPALKRGLCNTHYRRSIEGKKVAGSIRFKSPKIEAGAICPVEGCGRPIWANGLCVQHNRRRGRGASIDKPIRKRPTLDILQSLAHARGGRCLSEVYATTSDHYLWECREGHTWRATYTAVHSKRSWCPLCASGKGERICRAIIELMFGVSFTKEKPAWLRIPGTKKNLELDGFNADLGVAFEYQGVQHYEAKGVYRADQVADIQRRDAAKRQMCWARGIALIVVPEFKNLENAEQVLNQVELAVSMAGVSIPKKWNKTRPMQLPSLWS